VLSDTTALEGKQNKQKKLKRQTVMVIICIVSLGMNAVLISRTVGSIDCYIAE